MEFQMPALAGMKRGTAAQEALTAKDNPLWRGLKRAGADDATTQG
jgi:hypothetical protein